VASEASEAIERQIELQGREYKRAQLGLKRAIGMFDKSRKAVLDAMDKLAAAERMRLERKFTAGKDFLRAGEKHWDRASKLFFEALGVLAKPDVMNLEAEDLGRRAFGSASVLVPGDARKGDQVAHIGFLDREAGQKRTVPGKREDTSYLGVFTDLTRKLTPQALLESVPAEIAKELFRAMVKDAVDDFSPAKAKMVMDVLSNFMKFVEPKAVIATETPVDQWTEEETRAYLLHAHDLIYKTQQAEED
jgi:hypothetical protein